eukprot:210265-Pelagomonas_calceolata.AAC.11
MRLMVTFPAYSKLGCLSSGIEHYILEPGSEECTAQPLSAHKPHPTANAKHSCIFVKTLVIYSVTDTRPGWRNSLKAPGE